MRFTPAVGKEYRLLHSVFGVATPNTECRSSDYHARRRRKKTLVSESPAYNKMEKPMEYRQLGGSGFSLATLMIGARNEQQLMQNMGAVGWKLAPEHLAKLDSARATTRA